MSTYKIIRDTNNYKHIQFDLMSMLDTVGEKVGRMKFMHFSKHNLILAEHWQTFEGQFIQPEGLATATVVPDITTWRLADLVLSESAMKVLEQPLSAYGEFLPVIIDGQPFAIFNCLTDANVNESESEREVMDGVVMDVTKLVFDNDDIKDKLIFKCTYQGANSLYCTDTFKTLIEDHHLNGITFSENLLEIFS